LRLQDEPLGEEKVVRGLELGGEMPLTTDKSGDFEVEEVRGEALDAKGGPVAGWA